MLKSSKFKYMLMMLLIAVLVFIPCSNLVVQASSYIHPVILTTTEGESGTADSGSTGSSSESGTTESSGESGSTGSSEEVEEETPTIEFEGFAISTSVITDSNLYDALLTLFKSVEPNYKQSTIYSDMFDREEFTTINLDYSDISSLAGLNKLEFSYLESFSAERNNITEFDENIFKNVNVDNFKSISLASNELTSFSISKLTGLQNINLSNNSISRLDLSAIEARVQNTKFTLNVAGNPITSMSDIVLPTKRIGHVNLNLINTQINDISEDYFTDKYTLNIGVQGFKEVDSKYCVDTLNNVVIYKTNMSNLRVDVYKIDGESDELVASIKDSDIDGNYIRLSLGVGGYEYYYMLDDENVDAYNKYDSNSAYLWSSRFSVIPQKVAYVYVYKDKEYDTLGKVTGEVVVKLTSAENATILYQVNGGEWVEGDTINCNQGGTYSIKAKVIIDGVESEVENIWVRTSLNLYIPDSLMLVLILLLVLALFLVVLPIISRKYFKRD